MQAASCPARQTRAQHRHDLRTLTYVALDEANGGIIRNLSHQGIAVQAVSTLRVHQIVQVRFDLRNPRLRVEGRGEVVWATESGQCGIRLLDLPPRMVRQINEWIFGDLLEAIPRHWGPAGSIFAPAAPLALVADEDDGLILSPTPQKVIELQPRIAVTGKSSADQSEAANFPETALPEADWLSRPLSGRTLAWTVDILVMVAALLLFSLVFLSVVHELPKWPLNLEVAIGSTFFVAVFYWAFVRAFGGKTLGSRVARLVIGDEEDYEERFATRFR
jgi:hypothetical protein